MGFLGGGFQEVPFLLSQRAARWTHGARTAPLPPLGCPTDTRINWGLQEKERVEVKPSAGAASRHLREAAIPHGMLWHLTWDPAISTSSHLKHSQGMTHKPSVLETAGISTDFLLANKITFNFAGTSYFVKELALQGFAPQLGQEMERHEMPFNWG